MQQERIQRVVSEDGTGIVARVAGQGPPLVLLPAGPGDSDTSWSPLLPWLSERFTCYLLDTRGRGASTNHPDHSTERLVQDVAACLDDLGRPVGLVEWGTSLWARVAAEHATAITAVAAYEPGTDEGMNAEVVSRFQEVIFPRLGELIAEGRLLDAARAFIEHSDVLYNDEELAHGAPSAFWTAAAPNLPIFLQEQQQLAVSGAGPTSPTILGSIEVPVLLMGGTASRRWFSDSVRHVARHVRDARVAKITGAGHFGPHTHPEAVAEEIIRFFTAQQTA